MLDGNNTQFLNVFAGDGWHIPCKHDVASLINAISQMAVDIDGWLFLNNEVCLDTSKSKLFNNSIKSPISGFFHRLKAHKKYIHKSVFLG
jgi:hypothetical protein